MRRDRKSVSVTVDLELLEAGRAAVAEGRAWSFSAWVNEALRRQTEIESRLFEVVRTPPNDYPSSSGSRG